MVLQEAGAEDAAPSTNGRLGFLANMTLPFVFNFFPGYGGLFWAYGRKMDRKPTPIVPFLISMCIYNGYHSFRYADFPMDGLLDAN